MRGKHIAPLVATQVSIHEMGTRNWRMYFFQSGKNSPQFRGNIYLCGNIIITSRKEKIKENYRYTPIILYLLTPSLYFFSITFPVSAAVHFWLKAVVPKKALKF